MTQDARGRVALITGSTRGVGEAVARRLGVDKRVTELSTADLEAMLVPGLYGQFWACKYALPHLAAGGRGSVVNIS